MIKPLKAVYSYYFPEVRSLISDITKEFPHDVFLQSIDPGLDDFHKPVIASYLEHMKSQIPHLSSFPNSYTTTGSEAIFHILAEIKSCNVSKPLYVFNGEYEGYKGYGENLKLHFTSVDIDSDFSSLRPGIFFVSNPSARDGNILPNELLERIGKAGHEIILDLTYVGLTAPHVFKVDYPFVKKVVISLSKPFGLYYYRIGFCFSREPMPTLEVNKWFKNILSHIIAGKVLNTFNDSELAIKYKDYQLRAIDQLSKNLSLPLKASDVTILAYIKEKDVPDSLKGSIKEFKRGEQYRFCLTPYFLEYEKHNIL